MIAALYNQRIKTLAAQYNDIELPHSDVQITIDNPLCGDRVSLSLVRQGSCIQAIGCQVKGCILCRAAARIVCEQVPGTELDELLMLNDKLSHFLNDQTTNWKSINNWQTLAVFEPVIAHKSRHNCVLLVFKGLQQAMTKAIKGL